MFSVQVRGFASLRHCVDVGAACMRPTRRLLRAEWSGSVHYIVQVLRIHLAYFDKGVAPILDHTTPYLPYQVSVVFQNQTMTIDVRHKRSQKNNVCRCLLNRPNETRGMNHRHGHRPNSTNPINDGNSSQQQQQQHQGRLSLSLCHSPHVSRDVIRLGGTAGGVHHHNAVAAHVLRVKRTGKQLQQHTAFTKQRHKSFRIDRADPIGRWYGVRGEKLLAMTESHEIHEETTRTSAPLLLLSMTQFIASFQMTAGEHTSTQQTP